MKVTKKIINSTYNKVVYSFCKEYYFCFINWNFGSHLKKMAGPSSCVCDPE